MTENNNRQLLQKYINQQCNAEELKQVRQLLDQPAGQKELENLLDEDWNTIQEAESDEVRLRRWKIRFFYEKPDGDNAKKGSIYRLVSYTVAASVLLAFIAWLWTAGESSTPAPMVELIERENPAGQRSKILLPDSSVVYLGPASCLSYPETFDSNRRELSLEGEAFFEVRRDAKRPFIVRSGKVETRVLGTSFKIDSRDRRVAVAVATGKVRVSSVEGAKTNTLAELLPGAKLSYNELAGIMEKSETDTYELTAWKEGKLLFNNTALKDITGRLQNWYGAKILLQDEELSSYRLTLSVNGSQPLSHIMEIISSTANIKYIIEGQTVTLKKGGRK